MKAIFIELRRSGIEEPFLIRLDKIEGVTIQGIVVNSGEVIHTVETYEEIIVKLDIWSAILRFEVPE